MCSPRRQPAPLCGELPWPGQADCVDVGPRQVRPPPALAQRVHVAVLGQQAAEGELQVGGLRVAAEVVAVREGEKVDLENPPDSGNN